MNTNTIRRITAAATLTIAPLLVALGTATVSHADTTAPSPVNTVRTDGPNSIHDQGQHTHFLVNGGPADTMASYKSALEAGGWNLTVSNSGRGGATYVGTNGSAYGVFTGGGWGTTTDINTCTWPTKPANTNCGDRN